MPVRKSLPLHSARMDSVSIGHAGFLSLLIGQNRDSCSGIHQITDRIRESNSSRFVYTGCDTSVSAHGIVAPGSQLFLHFAAGVAKACEFEDGIADLKALVFESEQIDA